MEHLALYRKWRPKTFQDLVGQEHISGTLKKALIRNMVTHAYLFCGPRGTGKTSTAKLLARAVNCLNLEGGEPCNSCEPCRRILEGRSLDVFEIDAASNRGIDEIRELRENVRFAPAKERYKVYIIDEVHMLTNEAFNALLKTLEEPPEKVIFILATTEPHKVPATIMSRCQRFDFKRISDEVILARLEEVLHSLEVPYEIQALELITKLSFGGLRDALSLLDQCLACGPEGVTFELVTEITGVVTRDTLAEIVRFLAAGNSKGVLELTNRLLSSGKEPAQIIADLLNYCRDLLLAMEKVDHALFLASSQEIQKLEQEAQNIDPQLLWNLIENLSQAEKNLRWSNTPRVLIELTLLKTQKVNSAVREPLAPSQTSRSLAAPPAPEIKDSPPKNDRPSADPVQQDELWPRLLEAVKRRRITTYALLVEGTMLGVEQGWLKIAFEPSRSFHKNKLEEPENKSLVEECAAEVFNKNLKLKTSIRGEAIPGEPEAAESLPDSDDLVRQAVELFGGKVVRIKNEEH